MEKPESPVRFIPHCLVLPYPLQGHINPLLQFAKRLSHKGVSVTLAVTKQLLAKSPQDFSGQFLVETISDGFDQGTDDDTDLTAYLTTFKQVGTKTLAALLEKLRGLGRPVDCVIYNTFLPWAMAVAKESGAVGAPFFTQSCGVNCIYYSMCKGALKLPLLKKEIRIPGLGELGISDMPSFLLDQESHPGSLELVLSQFENIEEAVFVFVNSMYELEEEVTRWMSDLLPVKTVGPTVPSAYLDNRIFQDKDYGLSMFEPVTSCPQWLDKHAPKSVVYVSFGSMAKFQADQMEELWQALKMSQKPFLWVVRSSEESKLPEAIRRELTDSERGLVVPWCPQLEVLSHGSVGCFVTHCGWNSTLEGISLGVPMVGIPWWSDQSTNAKFVTDFWEVGIRARPDGGLVRKGEIARCIEHVMEGESGERVRKNARKWKEMARRAVDEGGSSDRNIEEFVSKLALLLRP